MPDILEFPIYENTQYTICGHHIVDSDVMSEPDQTRS